MGNEKMQEMLQKELEAKWVAEEVRTDRKARLQGFTHKVVALIHPSSGGDDYQTVLYWRRPPLEGDIKRELRRLRSAADTDYRVMELPILSAAPPDAELLREIRAEKARWFAKQAKRVTLFSAPGERPEVDGYRTVKSQLSPGVVAYIRAKYPGATIYGPSGDPLPPS